MKIFTLVLLLLSTPAFANDWGALRTPGAMAIMRHALAPGGGDPSNHTIDDCTTQRNLSEAGRAQARAIGEALRSRTSPSTTSLPANGAARAIRRPCSTSARPKTPLP